MKLMISSKLLLILLLSFTFLIQDSSLLRLDAVEPSQGCIFRNTGVAILMCHADVAIADCRFTAYDPSGYQYHPIEFNNTQRGPITVGSIRYKSYFFTGEYAGSGLADGDCGIVMSNVNNTAGDERWRVKCEAQVTGGSWVAANMYMQTHGYNIPQSCNTYYIQLLSSLVNSTATELRTEINSTKSQLADQARNATTSKNELKSEIQSLKSQLSDHARNATTRQDELKNKLAAVTNATSVRDESLTSEDERLKGVLEILRGDFQSMSENSESLQDEVNVFKAYFTSVKERLTGNDLILEDNLQKLANDSESLKEDLNGVKSLLTSVDERLSGNEFIREGDFQNLANESELVKYEVNEAMKQLPELRNQTQDGDERVNKAIQRLKDDFFRMTIILIVINAVLGASLIVVAAIFIVRKYKQRPIKVDAGPCCEDEAMMTLRQQEVAF